MKKATKVLLVIGEVLAFVAAASFFILAMMFFVATSDEQALLKALVDGGMSGVTIETVRSYWIPVLTAWGVVMLLISIFSIPTAIISIICRKKLQAGCEKKSLQGLAICLIIFGALSVEIPIVPAIFMLAMNESNFKKE
uniref:DUF4064 domain-containing protein n=1 Tax=uncultured bacterium fosmid pJB84G2 TaxID=1478072 RepID=A0A0H3U808_9BACT|nr:hypothetical protein [uncultured bacterium fosmid pJB84G2]